MAESVYDFSMKRLSGEEQSIGDYRGKVLLVVNVASKCGFTPQYEGLESMYKELQGQGFEILGFPCNQFGAQEPGDAEEIANFCQLNFGVTFPMFAKIDVNGSHAHPFYDFLKKAAPGTLGTTAIKWNFSKFLVDQEGNVVKRFGPNDKPAAIKEHVVAVLNK